MINKKPKQQLSAFKSVTSIEDLPQENQIKMINSVLYSPCIPLSLKFMSEAYPEHVKVDLQNLTQEQLEEQHPFTPKFFIDLVLSNPRTLNPTLLQININQLLAKAYESFAAEPDNPEHDGFRAHAKQCYEDVCRLKQQQKQKQQELPAQES